MRQLTHYQNLWALESPELLAETPTSSVWRVRRGDDLLALKVLTEVGKADEFRGAQALRHFDGLGAAHLVNHDDGAHLVEFVDGPSLLEVADADGDESAVQVLAQTLKRLHSTVRPGRDSWTSMRERFRALFAASANGSDQTRAACRVAERLVAEPHDECVLHGDLHHENIIMSSSRGWLAIDPKGLWGERAFDAANIFLNPVARPEVVASAERFGRVLELVCFELKLDRQRMAAWAFCYACLSATWSQADGDSPDSTLAVARHAERFLRDSGFEWI